eukprot:GHVU01201558.1.p2 GENE.GHVU01201558.1~~GHVU01201558.1.p2  ORF type:complete len:125 (-),score=1.44 GHVU01201558.1:129-503(-)
MDECVVGKMWGSLTLQRDPHSVCSKIFASFPSLAKPRRIFHGCADWTGHSTVDVEANAPIAACLPAFHGSWRRVRVHCLRDGRLQWAGQSDSLTRPWAHICFRSVRSVQQRRLLWNYAWPSHNP